MRNNEKDYNYKSVKADYDFNGEDDDRMRIIKEIVSLHFTEAEREIFIAYCELGSYAAVSRLFNVSAPTAKKYIAMLRNRIRTIMDNINDL